MTFQLLLHVPTKMLKNEDFSWFQSLRCFIYLYLGNTCYNAKNGWPFNISDHDKFHAHLSWAWNKFYNPKGHEELAQII